MKESNFQKKQVSNFLNHIQKNEKWIDSGRHKYPRINHDEIVNYFFSLDKREFTALISSPYWNGYPSWTNSYTSKKRYGDVVTRLVRASINSSNTIRNLFAKKSSGLWQRVALELLAGSERVACAKRGIKSGDKRVRLKSVEIVPNSFLVKNIKSLLSDRHRSISWKLMRRLGPDNFANIAMEYSSCTWTKRDAMRRNLADKDITVDSVLIELDRLKNITNDTSYNSKKYEQRSMIASMINELKTSDIPYVLTDEISNEIGFGVGNTIQNKLRVMEWAQD